MDKTSLCGFTVEEIFGIIQPGGFTRSHALKISHLIYKKGIRDLCSSSGLPRKLRDFLSQTSETGLYPPVSSVSSSDGTTKYIFRTPDTRQFETVLIPDKNAIQFVFQPSRVAGWLFVLHDSCVWLPR